MARLEIDKKTIAKTLYINGGNMTQEEIASKVGVTRQTIIRWIKADKWDELKASYTITPEQILAGFNRQIIEINRVIESREAGARFATPAESDTLVKLASASRKILDDAGLSDVVNVGIKFTNWLRGANLDHAKLFNDYFDTYIKEIMR
jgi:transcriptional regulator with XRE-family HTH domain